MGGVVMQAGSLRHRVHLQRRATGRDAAGQPSITWQAVASVWADVRCTSGLEAIKSGATTSVVQASIRIRWRADINSGMRAVHGPTAYDIKAVLPDARRVYIDLVCEVVT